MICIYKAHRIVSIDESWPYAGISSEIAYRVQKHAFDYLDAPVTRLNSKDVSMCYAPTLVDAFLPNVGDVIQAVKAVMYR